MVAANLLVFLQKSVNDKSLIADRTTSVARLFIEMCPKDHLECNQSYCLDPRLITPYVLYLYCVYIEHGPDRKLPCDPLNCEYTNLEI